MSFLQRTRSLLFEDPTRSWRFAIVFGFIGIAMIVASFLGPVNVYAFRFGSIMPIMLSCACFRAYYVSRRADRLRAQNNTNAVAVQPVSHSTSVTPPYPPTALPTQPYQPTGETHYGFNGFQNQGSPSGATNDPSIPPPYQSVTWPADQGTSQQNMPPPPSYEDVMRDRH